MIDGDLFSLIQRGVVALERLADHFAPLARKREKLPAILSKAIYDPKEREIEKRRKAARIQIQDSQR